MIVIDDCYQGLKASSPSSTPTELIAETLSKAGVSILLTSFTSIVAFMVGAFTDIPAVVYFCRNAALSFTWCFVLNVTLFPSLLVIDERRRSRGGEGGGEKAWGLGLREAASVALEKYSSLLSRPTFKALVFVVTLSAAWVCREEAMSMEVGMKPREVVAEDSSYSRFMDVIDECFETRTRAIGIYVYDLDYKDEEEVRKLGEMMERIEEQPTVVGKVGGIAGHWYMAYLNYLFGVKGFQDGEEFTR
jgi:predicted RND superfamily exporter protein